MEILLDKKDYKILRVLDENFRAPFSEIAKKVGLSKNSVALRFQKLKDLMLHNTTGINNRLLGYNLVKVLYVINQLDEKTENEIINTVKKYKNIIYVARLYGHYNIELALFVENFEELITQLDEFNKRFYKKISQKDVQIIVKEFFLRNNFLHENPLDKIYKILAMPRKYNLTTSEKKILSILRQDPRNSLIDISVKTGLNPKTVSINIKSMEKRGVIMGYFMTLDNSLFDLSTSKLLIQINESLEENEFESYLGSMKNVRHFSRMLGLWDYELDAVYPSILNLQKEIEILKQKFPKQIKKIEIISFGKRIATNKEKFLL